MIYDLIIIGGGPAGITAGIYAGRQKMKTLLITKEFGGQTAKKATEVCNYPGFERISGMELIDKFVEHLEKQESVEVKFSEAEKIEKNNDIFTIITTDNEKLESKSVIIATGVDPRPLEAVGEKEFIGKGISYCVTCDGPIFRNKTIAVIGGGNAGMEAALFMTNYATKIYVLEFGPDIKADEINQKDAKESGKIEIITNAVVKEIKGENFVNSLVYEDNVSKDPSTGSGQVKTLQVEGVFIEIGHQPATALAKGLVDFTKRDEIVVENETFATKTPGLFAAGDNNSGPYKQIVTAAGEGCKTALAAYDYLRKLNSNSK
ncbi:MAG: FAD-dependent oxidoreductase [Candidatus Staskawiczbacteria bacterium]|nr:FAD-dependent oxidoreductase [Candidatus Staskawiczbacteria bacterium]